MSITTNGAPLGTDGVKALASTDSWQSPSEYVDPITGKTEFRREEFGLPRVGDLVQFDWDVEGVSIGCFTATVEVAFNDGSNTVVVPLDQKVEVVRDMSRLIARESSR